jgi:glycosyltransferase involved in cell wall biosynthesis
MAVVSVSVIVTVKDEAASLPALLDSLIAQTHIPDEVVVVDGGSTDGTLTVLREYADQLPLRVLERPGANISQGRNAAIASASGEIIASTDAGVRLAPEWLAHLLAPFSDERVAVVSGFFLADPQTVFEAALGATVLPTLAEIDPARFLPSSRSVAFRKAAWATVGGYPEWLDYCEDLVFDFKLLERYRPFAFAPQAIAHFRPRSSLGAFFRQYYLYARGDGKARLWPKRHAIRYATYLVAAPGIAALGIRFGPAWWALYALGAAAMLWRPYARLARSFHRKSTADRLQAILWVPLIRITGDIAKMLGYPGGVLWRLRRDARRVETAQRDRRPA